MLTGQASGQSLVGVWQGAETDTGEPGAAWPTVLRLQNSKGAAMFGVLYQEVLNNPDMSVTFQVQGARTGNKLLVAEMRKLYEKGGSDFNFWCQGSISFTYDPEQEKLTGRATYRPIGDCDKGTFTLYRIKLKSASTVPAGTLTTIRVTGRDVQWYADAELTEPIAKGNTFRTRLSKTTTYFLTQGFYPTTQQTPVSITIQVTKPTLTPKIAPKPIPPVATLPLPPPPDTARVNTTLPAGPPLVTSKPVVLPKVLFKIGTADLLPDGFAALNQVVAELRSRPAIKIRVAGYADRLGESEKNQVLSEQRAEAVKQFLVKAGIAADRISTIGYGDSRPLYPSPDVRNRRVEVEEVPN